MPFGRGFKPQPISGKAADRGRQAWRPCQRGKGSRSRQGRPGLPEPGAGFRGLHRSGTRRICQAFSAQVPRRGAGSGPWIVSRGPNGNFDTAAQAWSQKSTVNNEKSSGKGPGPLSPRTHSSTDSGSSLALSFSTKTAKASMSPGAVSTSKVPSLTR